MPAKHTETIQRELNCDSQHRVVRAITLTYLHQCLQLTTIGGGFHESIVATMIAHSLSTKTVVTILLVAAFPMMLNGMARLVRLMLGVLHSLVSVLVDSQIVI